MFNNLILSYRKKLLLDNSYFYDNKCLFFFKFLKIHNPEKKYLINPTKLWKVRILTSLTDEEFWVREKKYKYLNFFKYSIRRYNMSINYIFFYSINNFIKNYKFNWMIEKNKITFNMNSIILNYNTSINLLEKIKLHLNRKKKYKFKWWKFIRFVKSNKFKFKNIIALNVSKNFKKDTKFSKFEWLYNLLTNKRFKRIEKSKNIQKKSINFQYRSKKLSKWNILEMYLLKLKKKKNHLKWKKKICKYENINKSTNIYFNSLTKYKYLPYDIDLFKKYYFKQTLSIVFNHYNYKTYQWRVVI